MTNTFFDSVNKEDTFTFIPWEEQTIANDFMFSKVMSNPELSKELLRRIFPQLNIEKVEDIEIQKTLKNYYVNKGVRLDVYVSDEKSRRYDIEMQMTSNQNIRKRSRYYASMLDANDLLKGKDYDSLSDTYIVFICTFDLFGMGYHKYSFKNICMENNSILLNDGAERLFLNTEGTRDDVDAELKKFLDFVKGREVEPDNFLKQLKQAVEEAKTVETWRDEYMTFNEIERRGFLQGEAIGEAKGKAEYISIIKEMVSNGQISEDTASLIISNFSKPSLENEQN